MDKLGLTSVLFSKKNFDLENRLHNLCKNYGVNLVVVSDFVDLIIKSIAFFPQIIFMDCESIDALSPDMNTFMEKSEFKNSKIIFVGPVGHAQELLLLEARGFFTATYDQLSIIVDKMQNKLQNDSFSVSDISSNYKKLDIIIYKFLSKIGFSAKHTGAPYLRFAIKSAVLQNGVLHALTKDSYPYVAAVFKTTTINVERNIRNAIDYAWNNYGKKYWHSVFFSKNMELKRKPSNREFITMSTEIIMSQFKYNIVPNY